jgi:hypothetical protein
VLLRHQQQPVTAGLLDVYGQVGEGGEGRGGEGEEWWTWTHACQEEGEGQPYNRLAQGACGGVERQQHVLVGLRWWDGGSVDAFLAVTLWFSWCCPPTFHGKPPYMFGLHPAQLGIDVQTRSMNTLMHAYLLLVQSCSSHAATPVLLLFSLPPSTLLPTEHGGAGLCGQ